MEPTAQESTCARSIPDQPTFGLPRQEKVADYSLESQGAVEVQEKPESNS